MGLQRGDDGADALHGGLTTGALERVGAPDAEDEVAPERVGKEKKKKREAGSLEGWEAGANLVRIFGIEGIRLGQTALGFGKVASPCRFVEFS